MKVILEVNKNHFIDYRVNYIIFFIVSVLLLILNYVFLQKFNSDIIYTAIYAIVAIPIFGIIILNKSTYLCKAEDIIYKKSKMAVIILYPSILVTLFTLFYYKIRMINFNVASSEPVYYTLLSSLVGVLALLIVIFVFLELKKWNHNWPIFFGNIGMLLLYLIIIIVYPMFHSKYLPTPYYMELTVLMLILFVTHIVTQIFRTYSKIEY